MKWRYFILFFACHNAFGVKIVQSQSERRGGQRIIHRESGDLYERELQRTFFASSHQNGSFLGIFTGHGPTKKEWHDALQKTFRKQGFITANFSDWLQINKYHTQLDLFALVSKVMGQMPGYIQQNVINDGTLGLRSILSKLNFEIKSQTKEIGTWVSTAFTYLNNNNLFMGAIGQNSAVVFQGVSGKGIWLPSESKYKKTCAIPMQNKPGIGAQNFNQNDCEVTDINLDPSGKYFAVLMNKPLRDCFTDDEIAQVYLIESYTTENLAQRVANRLLATAQKIYQNMQNQWISSAKKEDILQMPELAVAVTILNEPFINNNGQDKALKELEEWQASIIKKAPIAQLLSHYAKHPDQTDLKNQTETTLSSASVEPLKKEKPGFWHKLLGKVLNKYIFSTLFLTGACAFVYKYFCC